MLPVVVDPGVLVAALLSPGGPPAALLRAFLAGEVEIVASPHLLEELATVLARDKFRRYVTVEEAEAYVETLGRRVDLYPDSSTHEAVTSDPDDDYLVALARAVEADAIVSGDGDLLECAAAQPVLSPRAVIQRLSADKV